MPVWPRKARRGKGPANGTYLEQVCYPSLLRDLSQMWDEGFVRAALAVALERVRWEWGAWSGSRGGGGRQQKSPFSIPRPAPRLELHLSLPAGTSSAQGEAWRATSTWLLGPESSILSHFRASLNRACLVDVRVGGHERCGMFCQAGGQAGGRWYCRCRWAPCAWQRRSELLEPPYAGAGQHPL